MELKLKRNFLSNLLIFTAFNIIFTAVAFACSACFYGDPNQKAVIAVQWGVITLLVAVAGVIAAFVKFFISFNKRAQLLNKAKTI